MRMEALIGRIRLLVVLVNTVLLAFVLDTRAMHMPAAWGLVLATYLYGAPIVLFQPYRRWRVFGASMVSTALDTIGIAAVHLGDGRVDKPVLPAVLRVGRGRGDAL